MVLTVSNLTTHLGAAREPVRVADGVSFGIHKGETFALLGESGCGKSMTALSLMRLLPTTGRIIDGEVRLADQDLLKLPETAMRDVRGGRMAMIFQEPMTSLNPVMAVGEQIAEALRAHQNLRSAVAEERAVELLNSVGIPDPGQRIREFPHQLSGGMKQRVMIAIALAGDPELLIADEPTTALDVTIQAQVLDLLRTLQRERGMAILLITHDLGVVAEMADRIAVMYAGQIVEQARRHEFFTSPRHPYSRKLFESLPSMHKRGRPLSVIEGAVPSLKAIIPGCRFAARCDAVMDICQHTPPLWRSAGGSDVRCHLYSEGSTRSRDVAVKDLTASPAKEFSAAPSTTALLEVKDLKVHFPIRAGVFKRTVGHVRAVDGVTLAIPKGRTLALVGESGCGKTTVGKGILQLIKPTAGDVRFDGDELTQLGGATLRARRTDFQIIFQDPFSSMNPRMMVGDIIAEGMKAQGICSDAHEREQRVEELLTLVGLPADSRNRYPHEFSGGQRQRISIARALAVDPKLIVCDEPTSALDVSVQAQILNLLKQLQDELGISYLFITHDISVVSYIAHEVAVMYLGRVVEHGAADTILNHPRHPYTRALLSAVPTVEPDSGREIIRLEGDMPSPSTPPAGCHFHPRCPDVMDVCRSAYPATEETADGHATSCHLYGGR